MAYTSGGVSQLRRCEPRGLARPGKFFNPSDDASLPGDVEFALRYRVLGEDYWNNNKSRNYISNADSGVLLEQNVQLLNIDFNPILQDGQQHYPITVAVRQSLQPKQVFVHWTTDNLAQHAKQRDQGQRDQTTGQAPRDQNQSPAQSQQRSRTQPSRPQQPQQGQAQQAPAQQGSVAAEPSRRHCQSDGGPAHQSATDGACPQRSTECQQREFRVVGRHGCARQRAHRRRRSGVRRDFPAVPWSQVLRNA